MLRLELIGVELEALDLGFASIQYNAKTNELCVVGQYGKNNTI